MLSRGTTTDKRNFTWTTIQVDANALYAYSSITLLKPFINSGVVVLPVCYYAVSSSAGYAFVNVIGDTNGTLAAQAAVTRYNNGASGSTFSYRFAITTTNDIVAVGCNSTYPFIVRWSYSSGTWGAPTGVQLPGTSRSYITCAAITNGNIFLTYDKYYEVRDAANTVLFNGTYSSASTRPDVSSTSGSFGIDTAPNGNVVFSMNDGYVHEFDIVNNVIRHRSPFLANYVSQTANVTVDPNGSGDVYVVAAFGTAAPYAIQDMTFTGFVRNYQTIPNKISSTGNITDIGYLNNGDAVVTFKNTSTGKYEFRILYNNGTGMKTPTAGSVCPTTMPTAGSGEYVGVAVDPNLEDVHFFITDGKGYNTNVAGKLYYCRGRIDASHDNISWTTVDQLVSTGSGYNIIYGVYPFCVTDTNGTSVLPVWVELDDNVSGTQYCRYKPIWAKSDGTVTLGTLGETVYATRADAFHVNYAFYNPALKRVYIGLKDSSLIPSTQEEYGTFTPGNPGTWAWVTAQSPSITTTDVQPHYTPDGTYVTRIRTTSGPYFMVGNTTYNFPTENASPNTSVYALDSSNIAHVLHTNVDGTLWITKFTIGQGFGLSTKLASDVYSPSTGTYFPSGTPLAT
jgi:hypothetical protein